jgi:hypothetical protein
MPPVRAPSAHPIAPWIRPPARGAEAPVIAAFRLLNLAPDRCSWRRP